MPNDLIFGKMGFSLYCFQYSSRSSKLLIFLVLKGESYKVAIKKRSKELIPKLTNKSKNFIKGATILLQQNLRKKRYSLNFGCTNIIIADCNIYNDFRIGL